jgi:NADH-quinone oxidoreductase subunit H
VCIVFIIVRAMVPRYRFDQLLHLGWHIYLPFSFGYLVIWMTLLKVCNALIRDTSYLYH